MKTQARKRITRAVRRELAAERRAVRRRLARVARQERALHSAMNDAAMNLGIGIESRDRNVKLAFRAREIMNETRAERERILAQSALRVKVREGILLASLVASLALLGFNAWRVFNA